MAPDRDFNQEFVEAWRWVLDHPPPEPDDPRTELLMWERAKIAGFDPGQAATLARYLPPEDVVDACWLVEEKGCPPHLAGRIVG